jgi:hypothetical protein
MSSNKERFRIVVLDDYQNVALSVADWSVLDKLKLPWRRLSRRRSLML